MDELPPRVFPDNPRFEMRGVLGEGGMGVVFLAWDTVRREQVALKVVSQPGGGAGFRARGEFRIVADVQHPNLARLHDLFVDEDGTYFTMEYVAGGTIAHWVRGDIPSTLTRWERLLSGARALFRALDHLHAEGFTHGDVKPGNVLVDPDGVVKLADFGLVREEEAFVTRVKASAGTALFLPPEVFVGEDPGRARDLYAAGLTLLEMAVGTMPFPDFDGDHLSMAMVKLVPIDRGALDLPEDVPPWFLDLVFALVDPDPLTRPTMQAVLRGLGITQRRASVFVGRAEELERLRAEVEAARHGMARVLEVAGPSGAGKTALVQHFLRALRHGLHVLPSRCRQKEQVRFNALDAAVDALSRILVDIGPTEARAIVPQDAGPLCRLFPVLQGVPSLESVAVEDSREMSPNEVRARGAVALRYLIEALSRRRPVVLWVDDAQWADWDSRWLLGELLRPPRVPSLLVILTIRADALDDWRRATADLRDGTTWSAMPLPALGPTDAMNLARSLIDDEHTAAALAGESGGNPFFLHWLSRRAQGRAPSPLPEAVAEELAARPEEERDLLRACAVAEAPLPIAALLGATERTEGGRSLVDRLVLDRLLQMRRMGDGGDEALVVELTHAHVLAGALRGATPESVRAIHGQLADALSALGHSGERVVRHLAQAGRRADAAIEAWVAAEAAAVRLAFAAAANFYRLASDYGIDDPLECAVRRADCLVYAGQLGEASEVYEIAAGLSEDADSVRAVDLRRQAAEQAMHWGEIERGKALFADVLTAVGVPVIDDVAHATRISKYRRLGPILRKYPARSRWEATRERRVRLDALWGATTSLALVNHHFADAYGVLHLREALDTDEPGRLVRSLGYEAAFLTGFQVRVFGKDLGPRLLRRVLVMAEAEATPYNRAWARMSAGTIAWHQADWRRCVDECRRAERIYAGHCRGVAWERAITHVHRLYAQAQLGDLGALAEMVDAGLHAAVTRGDRFAANHHRQGPAILRWLGADQPELARQRLAEARDAWGGGDSLFSTHHYHHLLAAAQVDLYQGRGDAAAERIERWWPKVAEAQFLRLGYVGAELEHLRARAAVAPENADPGAAGIAQRTIRKLERRKRVPVAAPFVLMIKAAMAARGGEPALAVELLGDAAVRFEGLDMALHAACARLRAGQCQADLARVAAAAAEIVELGVAAPGRMAAVIAPGWPSPAQRTAT